VGVLGLLELQGPQTTISRPYKGLMFGANYTRSSARIASSDWDGARITAGPEANTPPRSDRPRFVLNFVQTPTFGWRAGLHHE
jgi:hypothetical protein